jgi:hypothetical protein
LQSNGSPPFPNDVPRIDNFMTMLKLTRPAWRTWLQTVMLLALVCNCASKAAAMDAAPKAVDAVFTVQAEGQRAVVRVLTHADSCPSIVWSGKPSQVMTSRAVAATLPVRQDALQADSKPAVFDVLTCEATWPQGVQNASVAGTALRAPRADIQRIVIIADTGCRMKGSENAFQDCNDPAKWPFAKVAQSAAAKHPDLVIHIGDIHYRESPCPAGNAGCANVAWGYGYDAWQADFFKPAAPLLAAAPWVFVRGNHEICARAGQGWYRFIDAQPWSEARSCNQSALDHDADFSQPYAVSLSPSAQLLVFDSSKTSGKPYNSKDLAFSKYKAEMQLVQQLARQKPHSFFMSHHPLLAVAPSKNGSVFKDGGSLGLTSVFETLYPTRLLPDGIDASMHGHLHFFEAISFKTAHPASLIMGNSGSGNEGAVATALKAGANLHGSAIVEDYAATAAYGFVTLDRVDSGQSGDWMLTEYDTDGQAVFHCKIQNGKSQCVKSAS